jgi:hypothetical protein
MGPGVGTFTEATPVSVEGFVRSGGWFDLPQAVDALASILVAYVWLWASGLTSRSASTLV